MIPENGANRVQTMTFTERLEQYRLILKQLESCTKALHEFGFVTDIQLRRTENFIDEEKFRTDRARKAFGSTVNANTPPTAGGLPRLDAARRAAGAGS